jgi:hypothetical protein
MAMAVCSKSHNKMLHSVLMVLNFSLLSVGANIQNKAIFNSSESKRGGKEQYTPLSMAAHFCVAKKKATYSLGKLQCY